MHVVISHHSQGIYSSPFNMTPCSQQYYYHYPLLPISPNIVVYHQLLGLYSSCLIITWSSFPDKRQYYNAFHALTYVCNDKQTKYADVMQQQTSIVSKGKHCMQLYPAHKLLHFAI